MKIRIPEAAARRPVPALSAPAFVLAMLAVAVAGYVWLPRAETTLPPVEGCRLDRQPCAIVLPDGGRLEVELAPRPVPTAAPVRVVVVLSGAQADRVEVDFQGVEMNMGLHRLALDGRGGGRFAGETNLPVCVTGRMVWQATVRIERGRKEIAVPFRFESGHS